MVTKIRREETRLKDSSFQILQLQQSVSVLKKDLATVEVQLNDREVQKQTAVQERRFRDAHELATEIKSLKSKMEALEEAATKAEDEKKREKQKAETIEADMERLQQELKQHEAEKGLRELQELNSLASELASLMLMAIGLNDGHEMELLQSEMRRLEKRFSRTHLQSNEGRHDSEEGESAEKGLPEVCEEVRSLLARLVDQSKDGENGEKGGAEQLLSQLSSLQLQ
uniref:Uncharacterized protein n=1 Tax=Palpitomonas bilix TaxID=652834 RepID=A0A7S3DK34_9EUKA|mmetsp:Transcript_41539/g.107555  ORF Transcript_41539/g.107555 Transcript_41539/m.107555 type:complete len:227 (+) Transcript_41539:76-756(+)